MIVYYDKKGTLEYEDYKFKICPDLIAGYDIVAFGYFNGIYKGMPMKCFRTKQDANTTLCEMNQAFKRGDEVFSLRFNHYW